MKLATITGVRAFEHLTPAQLAREVALVGGLALATGLAAHVRLPLPFTPVPLTLQTLVVLVAGGLLGARRGVGSQVAYLLLAATGLPLLAGPTLVGPTGGYLLGFVAAAAIMGYAATRQTWAWLAGGALAATLAIYACGVTWLCLTTGQGLLTGLHLGVAPFVAGDLLKGVAALGIVRAVRR
jgi:biotin transport system substrate-specific component